jgi:hypothetical protein
MANPPAPPKTAAAPAEFAHRPARVALGISRAANGNCAVALAERLVEAFATMVLIRRYEEHLYRLVAGRCISARARRPWRSDPASGCMFV